MCIKETYTRIETNMDENKWIWMNTNEYGMSIKDVHIEGVYVWKRDV